MIDCHALPVAQVLWCGAAARAGRLVGSALGYFNNALMLLLFVLFGLTPLESFGAKARQGEMLAKSAAYIRTFVHSYIRT